MMTLFKFELQFGKVKHAMGTVYLLSFGLFIKYSYYRYYYNMLQVMATMTSISHPQVLTTYAVGVLNYDSPCDHWRIIKPYY